MRMTASGFDIIRKQLGKLTQSQVNEINFIVSVIDDDKFISYPQAAYILATVWHETATTILPIVEYGKGKGLTYGTWLKNSAGQLYCFKDGKKMNSYLCSQYPYLYYGRGYVQLTWFNNYELASKKLGVDFLKNPDLVCQKEHAVKIMLEGMKQGWFTGRKLADYLDKAKKDYVGARRIINGTDKAASIAGYAVIFEKALRSS